MVSDIVERYKAVAKEIITIEMETFNYSNSHITKGRKHMFPNFTFVPYTEKFISCQSHVYLIASKQALEQTVYYNFQVANARRENPRYIVLWNCYRMAESEWKLTFKDGRFYTNFMDIRLYVGQVHGKYTIGTVCMICASQNIAEIYNGTAAVVKYLETWTSVDNGYMQDQWIKTNKNHYLHEMPMHCTLRHSCRHSIRMQYTRSIVTSMLHQIGRFANVTFKSYDTNKYDGYGLLHLASVVDGRKVKNINRNFSPRLLRLGYGIKFKHFSYFTLMHTKLLRKNDWLVVFVPFVSGIWYEIAGAFTIIVYILYRAMIRCSLSECILRAFAPLIDQHFQCNGSNWSHQIILLWSCLCMSLTVIYGGDLAASLTLDLPPSYPKDLFMYTGKNFRIFTTTSMFYGRYRIRAIEGIISGLHDQSKSKYLKAFSKAMLKIKHFGCSQRRYKLNMSTSDPNEIVRCPGDSKFRMIFTKPIVVLNYDMDTKLLKTAYDTSRKFWASGTRALTNVKFVVPWVLLYNYFSKLILPTISSWSESGLENHWDEVVTKLYESSKVSRKFFPAVIATSTDSVAAEVIPINLASISSLFPVFLLLLGLIVVTMLAEVLSTSELFKFAKVVTNAVTSFVRYHYKSQCKHVSRAIVGVKTCFRLSLCKACPKWLT